LRGGLTALHACFFSGGFLPSLILMQMKGSPWRNGCKNSSISRSCLRIIPIGHCYRTGGGDQTSAISEVTVTNALKEFTKILSGYMKRAHGCLKPKGAAHSVNDSESMFLFCTSYCIQQHNGSSNDLQQIKGSFTRNQT